MSQIINELKKSVKKVKCDEDYFDICFGGKSKSYIRNSRATISNFHCWLENDKTSTDELFEELRNIVDDEHREQVLVKVFNMFLKYLGETRPCPQCHKGKKNSKWRDSKCNVCHDNKTLKPVRSLKQRITHLKKYFEYYGFTQVSTKIFFAKMIFQKNTKEETVPLTDKMFKELFAVTESSNRRLYLQFAKLTGLRPKEILQLDKTHFEAISVKGEKMKIPNKWSELNNDSEFRKLRIILEPEMTKTGKGRHSWVSDQIVDQILNLLDQRENLLFTDEHETEKAVRTISCWFTDCRRRLGKVNPVWLEKFKNGNNKYLIYSLRAKFISDCRCADTSGNAGHLWAGHEKYMQQYQRYGIKDSLDLYNKAEEGLRDDKTSIPEGIESEVAELRKEKMQMEEEKELREIEHQNEIRRIHEEASKQREEDLADIEYIKAKFQIRTPKKKSK